MSLRLPRICLVILAAQSCLWAQPGSTVPPSATNPYGIPNPEGIVPFIRLPDADIDTFINTLEIYTGHVVLRPAVLNVAANVSFNLVIPTPTSRSDIVRAMETVLQLNGISVIYQDEKFLKIVNNAQARQESPRLIEGSTLDRPPSGIPASKIFVLDFANAQQVFTQIGSLLSAGPTGFGGQGVITLASANALMVTDTLTNLQRIQSFLKTVDRPLGENVQSKFYALKNARDNTDIVTDWTSFSAVQLAQLTGTTTFNADDRTNQVIITSDPRQFALFDTLIDRLDIAAAPNTSSKVIHLKQADATQLAAIINNTITGATRATTAAAGRGGQQNQQLPAGRGNVPIVTPPVPAGAVAPGGAAPAVPAGAAGPAGPAGAVAAAPAVAGANADPNANQQFSGTTTVVADQRSNSIIIYGSANDIKLVEVLVDGLDIVLDQVAIEVVIAEVNLTDSDVSGLGALNLAVGTDTPAGTVTRSLDGTAATIAGGDGNRGTHITSFAGTLGGLILSNGQVNPLAYVASLGDAGRKGNVKIVQSNTVVTTHARQATFAVTTNEPIPQSSTDANGIVTVTPAMQEVGIQMQVTPLIGKDGSIQLDITQTVDDVIDYVTIGGNPTPRTSHREAVSYVTVRDGEMIILGGLQSNKQINSRNKIGIFFEIPGLSHLFGARNRTDNRTQLLFFIRPRIVKYDDASSVTQAKINQLQNKDDVNKFLVDPAAKLDKSLLELVK